MKQAVRGAGAMAAAVLGAVVLSMAAFASSPADKRCDELMSGLRDGDFNAATAHFDSTVKAALSPEQLGAVWHGLTAANGKLLSWKITQRSSRSGQDIVVAPLKFERNSDLALVLAVNPQSGEISGLHFVPDPPATAPPYAVANDFHSIDVQVGTAPYALPGILTIPTNGKGPWPAVVLLGGSGPGDMNESLGPNHIFKDLAEGLSSRGIVVLRYDKRTHDYAEKMDMRHFTVKEEYLDDAIAAVKLLRSRQEVAPDQIYIAGHSLGATIAPEVALKAAPVKGLILLAPSGRKLGAINVRQMRFLGEASHKQLDELERKANELDNHLMPPTENFLGAPASYYYDLEARDEVAIARQLHVPILILHGGRDYQVIDQDIEHWQEGLKGVDHVRVETFPALNHLFIAGTGKPNKQEYGDPGHVDVKVIDAMTAFIENPLSN
jgi:dienelactone hydrolase